MTTHIKQERFDEFKKRAFEYGFRKVANEWVSIQGGRFLGVKENGELYAFVNKEIITDVPFEYIQKLVWDGFIKKY